MSVQAGPLKPDVLDSDDRAWFYNRVGVGAEDLRQDQSECQVFGAMMVGSTATVPGPYGLVGDIMGAIASAGLKVAYVDDCMMSKGYRRFDLAGIRLQAFAERMAVLPPETLQAYFSAEVPPEGVLGRQWSNSYWVANPGEPDVPTSRRYTPQAVTVQTFNNWGQPNWIKPLESGAISQPSADQAVLLLRLASSTGNARLGFDRRTADGDAGFIQIEGRRRWPGIEPRIKDAATPAAFAFVVPPGIYSLGYLGIGRQDYSTFCYGTLAFDVRPGEIIDLGDVTIEPGGVRVDPLAPEPATRVRIDRPDSSPERAALLGLKGLTPVAAAYRNLFPRKCQLFSRAYGIEIPGAPDWTSPAGSPPP